MSAKNDLAFAYHMGYDDALAKRKPDASKTEVLASGDLAAENAKLRELVRDLREHIESDDGFGPDIGWMLDRMRELGVEVDG